MKNIINKVSVIIGTIIGAIVMVLCLCILPYIGVCISWCMICWCFGIEFSAKVALGIYLCVMLLQGILIKRENK